MGLVRRMLAGVGDRTLGEWLERGVYGTVHLRRRLSRQEVEHTGLVMRDIRGTNEERDRLDTLPADLLAKCRLVLSDTQKRGLRPTPLRNG